MHEPRYVLVAERYPCRASAVPEARRLAALAYAAAPIVRQDVVALLVSEVVTNAVLHSGGAQFDLICHSPVGGAVQIEVHDRGPALPRRRAHAAWDCHGRGLELLDLLAPGWSVAPTLTGKSLTFTVAPEASAEGEPAHVRGTQRPGPGPLHHGVEH